MAEEEDLPPRTVYVVQKLHWQYNDNWHALDNDTPVKAFTDRGAAQRHADTLEEAERREVAEYNMADHFGGIGRMMTLDYGEFARRVAALGFPAPPDTALPGREFRDQTDVWLPAATQTASLEQWAGLWNLFDRIRFYEVVEVELEP